MDNKAFEYDTGETTRRKQVKITIKNKIKKILHQNGCIINHKFLKITQKKSVYLSYKFQES